MSRRSLAGEASGRYDASSELRGDGFCARGARGGGYATDIEVEEERGTSFVGGDLRPHAAGPRQCAEYVSHHGAQAGDLRDDHRAHGRSAEHRHAEQGAEGTDHCAHVAGEPDTVLHGLAHGDLQAAGMERRAITGAV